MEDEKNTGGRIANYTADQIYQIVSDLRAKDRKLNVTPTMVSNALRAQGIGSSNMASLKAKVLEAVARYDNQETDRLLLTVGDDERASVKEMLASVERKLLTSIARQNEKAQASVLGRIHDLDAALSRVTVANGELENALIAEQALAEDLRGRLNSSIDLERQLREKLTEATISIARLEAKLEVHESALMRDLRFRSDDQTETFIVSAPSHTSESPDAAT